MDPRRRLIAVSLLVVFALLLQSLTPALAVASTRQSATEGANVDMAGAAKSAKASLSPTSSSSAVSDHFPYVQRPVMDVATPIAPHARFVATGARRAEQDVAAAAPMHLQTSGIPTPWTRGDLRPGLANAGAILGFVTGWLDEIAAKNRQFGATALVSDFAELPVDANVANVRSVQPEHGELSVSPASPSSPASGDVRTAAAAETVTQSGAWVVGNTIGLNCGTAIHVGPGLAIHTIVPEDNWTVMITGGPRTFGGQTWWDTSRAAAGDPSGGTGWVSQQQSEAATCSGGGDDPAIHWAAGETVGLCLGTEIRHGPELVIHTVVPEADWTVKIIGGPIGANGQTWWNTSRKEAGDPSGGTGWVSQQQAEAACTGNGNPDAFWGLEALPAALRSLYRTLGISGWLLRGMAGDPVNVTTGGLNYSTTDFHIPGVAGFDLVLERSYHSNDTRAGAFGTGWSSLLDTSLRVANDGTIDVRFPDGHGTFFVLDGNQYVPGQSGVFDTLTYDDRARSFELTTAQQVTFVFTDKGRLTAMGDRNGNKIIFERDSDRIVRVIDSGGRTFVVRYEGDRVSAVIDPIERSYSYSYTNDDLVAVTDRNGGVHRFEYADHRVTRMVDPEGIAYLQNIYDAAGQIIEQIDAAGSRAQFAYDATARRTVFTDNLGNKTVYEYDELMRITGITDALNQAEHFQYDAAYNVIRHTNKRGLIYTYEYDERGNQLAATDPLGGVRRFTYNETNDLTSVTDALNRVTRYEYDSAGHPVRTVHPDGANVRATYDGRGQMLSQTDPNGNITTYDYDSSGNLTHVRNALQASINYVYDRAGRQIAASDANGHRTEFVYDGNDNLVRLVDPKRQPTAYRYDGNDSLVEIIDRRSGITRFSYDPNLKLVSEQDPEGHVTRYAYDAMYNRISVVNPLGQVTTYRYDTTYRLVAVQDALGNVSQRTLDANGNVLSLRDPLGRETTFEYDALDRLVKETDPLGGVTTAHYDAGGQMIDSTSVRPATTHYEYDLMGRIVLVKDALGGEWRSVYDPAGNLVSTIDANGHAATYGYDAANRLSEKRDAGGHTVAFAYDGAGNLTAETDGRGEVTRYGYDENDNLVTVIDALGGVTRHAYDAEDTLVTVADPSNHVTQFTYDLDGQLRRIIDANGHVTEYAYDAGHHLIRATEANGGVWAFVFDGLDRMTKRTDPEGQVAYFAYDAAGQRIRTAAENGVVARYDFDELGRIVAEVRNEHPGQLATATVNVMTRFVYDGVGNRVRQVDANGKATTSTYDLLNRLLTEQDAAGQVKEYTYDLVGNLTAFKNPRGFITHFAYDDDNLLTNVVDALNQEVHFAYDANHNQTMVIDAQGIGSLSAYDALNQLTATIQNYRPGMTADHQTNVAVRHTYNPDGTTATTTDANGNTAAYVYDPMHRLIAEQDALGGVVRYQYDPMGNLVQKVDANGHESSYRYDLLNRLLVAVDAAGHRRQNAYDAVGNVVSTTNARGNATRIRYDALDRVATITDAREGVVSLDYDAVGNVLHFKDQNAHTRSFTYDEVYRLSTLTDAAGYVTAYRYDANGNRTALIDGNQHQTTYGYDALDRLESTTNPEGQTTRLGYDVLGNVTHQVDADGVVTRYVYDPLYRLAAVVLNERPAAVVDAGTNVRYSYGYDGNGNLRAITDPLNHTNAFTYDALNRLIGEVNPIGGVWSYGYDAVGNLTSRRDGNGALTGYQYTVDDLLREVIYPDGSSVLHEYDANHNRIKLTDRLGVSTWSYDELDRMIETTDVHNRALRYAYDPVGNRTQVTYPDTRTVNYAYSANDWLKSVTDPNEGVTTYTRDGVGLPIAVTNPNETVTLTAYDKASRLLSLVNQQTVGAKKTLSAFQYTLDAVGQRTNMDAEYGWRQPAQVRTTYTYDALRRLTRVEDSAGVWTEYDFDAVGNRLALRTNDNAFSVRPFDAQTIRYNYNDANQLLTELSDTRYGSGPKQVRTDKVAQAIVAFQHEVSAQAGKHIEAATADALLSRTGALLAGLYAARPLDVTATAAAITELRTLVTAARQSGAINSDAQQNSLLAKLGNAVDANSASAQGGDLQATTYLYDGNGNRITKQWSGPQGPAVQGVEYRYSDENLLVQAQEYKGVLRQSGAALEAPVGMRMANQVFLPAVVAPNSNRAVMAPGLSGKVEGAVTTMGYDGIGRRLVKTVDPKVGAGGAKRTEYVFDLLDPVAEFSMWNGQYSNFYRGDAQRLVSMQTFPSGQSTWYQQDGLGSTVGLSGAQGQSVHNYRYDVYGMVKPVTGNWTEPHNRFTFTGQEWDRETSLLHFYARDYDPAVGVWLQQDMYRGRLDAPTTLQRYGYVAQNPVMYQDHNGYAVTLVVAVVGVVGGAVIGGGVDVAAQLVTTGKVDWKQAGASAVGGAVQGGVCVATAGLVCAVGGGAIGAATTAFASQLFHGTPIGSVDLKDVGFSALVGAGTGAVSGVAAARLVKFPGTPVTRRFSQAWFFGAEKPGGRPPVGFIKTLLGKANLRDEWRNLAGQLVQTGLTSFIRPPKVYAPGFDYTDTIGSGSGSMASKRLLLQRGIPWVSGPDWRKVR